MNHYKVSVFSVIGLWFSIKARYFAVLLVSSSSVMAETPPASAQMDPAEMLVIDDFPSPYDEDEIDLEALVWVPQGPGPFPAVIMMHGSGGLYYKSDDQCADDDRSCWGLSGKFKYWGKQLSLGGLIANSDQFLVLAVDSHTPRGYDHFGVANIDAEDRPTNVSSYLGRPWDLYAALRYLQGREDVVSDAIFAIGFSDGGGAVVSSVAASDQAALVNESDWFSGIDNNSQSGRLEMRQLGLKGAVAYYPSCGFFGYFDGGYTNYAPLLIQTGLLDDITPISACLDRQTEAFDLGVNPVDFEVIGYENMDHGFDYNQYETKEACLAAQKTILFFSQQSGDDLFRDGFEANYCDQY